MSRSRLSRIRTAMTIVVTAAALTTGLAVGSPAGAADYAAGNASMVARLTGPGAINDTVGRYQIIGTDLGIMWDNGRGEILTAFGDTQSFNGWSLLHGSLFHWRSNVLLRSTDRNLADGMTFTGHTGPPGYASRLLKPNLRREITLIPTAGVAVGNRQYLNYMSVKRWVADSHWVTNFSGLAVSTDNGRSWHRTDTYRPNSGGNVKFQMSAYLKVGDTVYQYGTPDSRWGAVYLARVPASQIENLGAYEYFSRGRWVPRNPGASTPIMPPKSGEMSVAWNSYLGKYVALVQTDPGVMLRTADSPQGPWSAGELVVSRNDPYSGYAPFIHPWSTSGSTLYFTYSVSYGYQVYLMRLPLRRN
ncbi:DUF4185 domain-containing protein [Gordonia sp. VNK1]|uniref:DUF4185 domain-containing protein n=1 Tax=Gordonia oleivorans TaxID=3156618 RepID=UPI0032B44F4C